MEHLPGIRAKKIQTQYLNIHYLDTENRGTSVLCLHGNASSSTFWEEAMLALPESYRGLAPDLRGYGLTDPHALVDATQGVGQWVDDLWAFLDALDIDRFHLLGHSMGGMVGWGVLADPRFAGRILSATLVAPGPPCGFGGLQSERGLPNNVDYSGSGAGLVHPEFARMIASGERSLSDPLISPRAVMNRLFWKPPFQPSREEVLLTAVLQVHCGEQQFPGDVLKSDHWPFFAPGKYGPANAMSGCYNVDLWDRLMANSSKPPLLIVFGEDDPIISDQSPGDPAILGKLGVLPGWPGESTYPPQPFLTQVKTAFREYGNQDVETNWLTIPDCGHTPYLEKPEVFNQAFHQFLIDHSQ